ncbi:MAG: DEAD/DEAH box helicase [Candidatus Thorarchaeota archaeon]|nr:MAG: hypothetical protein DRP09_08465 [Candidatus Thorarchaeota archaeon]RLI59649.1 MAG: hypothetical protein DRO87_02355 [Candidatus Thorarchaeota archaeon]
MATRSEDQSTAELREQLKALSNRYAIEILQVLSPETGEIVPTRGWDQIVEGLLELEGVKKPRRMRKGEKTAQQVLYERKRQSLMSGGTIYETMNKLVRAKFVVSTGEKGKRQRGFMITHRGRLALATVGQMGGPIGRGTKVEEAARILLRHKNFVRLLPAQEKFIREVEDLDENLVIQMPPGSGKTFLAMIAVLMKLRRGVRCLYLSPYTSLSRQVVEEYGPLFEELGYSVVRHDGANPASDVTLEGGDLIVVMYESFLAATLQRKKWTENVGLTVVDELTELGSVQPVMEAQNIGTDRSTKLDSIMAIMKERSQIITLSSRFGETDTVSGWLGARVFRPDVRLTPDEFTVMKKGDAFSICSSDGTLKSTIERDDVLDAVIDHLGEYKNKSILIVVGSRLRAQGIARRLAHSHPRNTSEELVKQIVGNGEHLPLSDMLEKTLRSGTAFHHSGLDSAVRERLENAIKNRYVRTVVATTGITSGISFPFDCVIILLDRRLYYLSTRARYLQVAGRIGEYHLRRHGGRVYLVFEEPSRRFSSLEVLEETLLHRPLEPLIPGAIFPSLAVGILVRHALKRRAVKRDQIKKTFLSHVRSTLRGTVDRDYADSMDSFCDSVLNWLLEEDVFEENEKGLKMTKDSKDAVVAGLDIIDFLRVRTVSNKATDSELVDLLLDLRLPQVIRPLTLMPSIAEMKILNLEPPDEWYLKMVPDRRNVKKTVLQRWMNEEAVGEIVRVASETAHGISLDEGDLVALLGVCSATAESVSDYFLAKRERKLALRMRLLSRQLRFGVKRDLAETDLLELLLIPGEQTPSNRLSRKDARTLFKRGYKSISDIVRKDLGATKKGFARDRFAKNSGLDPSHALEVYKAAMRHIRAAFEE